MSAVNITNVAVLDNPAAFLNPFQFEISYECLTPLKDGKISHKTSQAPKPTFLFIHFYFYYMSFKCGDVYLDLLQHA